MSSSSNEVALDVVSTYAEFDQWIKDFAKNKINFLGIIGPRGTGKSTAVKEAMVKQRHLYHKGVISARMFYEKLFVFRNFPVVLDDVTSLLGNSDCADMVMSLCDSDETKTIRYGKKNLGTISVESLAMMGGEDDEGDADDESSWGKYGMAVGERGGEEVGAGCFGLYAA